MEVNFVDTYVPTLDELERQQVLDMRDTVQQFVTVSFPDVASQPGTVVGDLLVTPQSYILAAFQQGVQRILSDLDLEAVANGTVYNCEFVQQYIKNLGISAELNYPSSGVVRITFSADKTYFLDRSTQFRIGELIYNIYLPNNGGFYCFATDAVTTQGINGTRIKELQGGRYFCDIPVVGNNGEVDIQSAQDVEISQYIDEITSIVTLTNFSTGSVNRTIEQLARDSQTTIYSASLNTRNGAVQYIRSICPFVESVAAVKSGDRELIRDYRTIGGYGISTGCLDIYARSNSYEFTESQVVDLVKVSRIIEGETKEWYEGEWHYVGQPYHVESVTHDSLDLIQLDHDILTYNQAGPDGTSLGAMVSYTQNERLFLRIPEIIDGNDTIFDTFMGTDGETHAYFRITYQTDPLLPSIAQTVENRDHAPINSSVVVRGFIPVIIDSFSVVYVKKPGVIPDLQQAEDDIKVYLAQVGAPSGYTDAEISRIMGEAGVQYMKRVDVQAHVQWSVANYALSIGEKIEDTDPYVWNPERIEPVIELPIIRDSDGLRVTYPNIGVPITDEQMYSCSPRNIRYFVMENAITFKEIVDV